MKFKRAQIDRSAHEWSAPDCVEVAWLAALPAVGSAVFALAFFNAKIGLFPLAFLLTATGAYATAFLGVVPIMYVFRARGWTTLYHYAIAGVCGVFVPWYIVGVAIRYLDAARAKYSVEGALLLACLIGAACSATFGYLSRNLRSGRASDLK